ncbi:MAG: HEAT repeat domain-containing protein [Candidatus Solibacter sp.]
MAIYAGSKDLSADEVREALAGLVRTFEADATSKRKQIKDLFDNNQEPFCSAAIALINDPGESRGVQYLVSVLTGNGMLLRALGNSELSRDEAVTLARSARRSDPLVEVAIARSLADSALGSGQIPVEDAARLLDVLAEIADAGRIVPSLMRLMRHPDAYLRSKAVKMIGRSSHSAKWVMGRLSESDPRVRANAVESLWAVDIPEARTLLNFAASDAHHRVVGNSLLGLYYLGDSAILADVVKLAGHYSADFRASAAWLMGESGDPRFADALRRMIADSDAGVRKRAFVSLAQLKAVNYAPPVGDIWHLSGRMLEGETNKGLKRLKIGAAYDDLREARIAPAQFMLSEGNQHILNYKVTEKALPEAMSVVFVIPRDRDAAGGAFFQGVVDCLRWKRPSDPWSILPYIEAGTCEAPPPRDPEPPVFTTNADALAASLRETPKKLDCTDLWTGVWRAIKPEGGQSRGKRHVIILTSVEETRDAGHGLISQMSGRRLSMQVVRTSPNPLVEEFCELTQVPHRCGSGLEIRNLVHQAYLNLLARYEIAWQPVTPVPSPLKVRVQTLTGWGETVISQAPPCLMEP